MRIGTLVTSAVLCAGCASAPPIKPSILTSGVPKCDPKGTDRTCKILVNITLGQDGKCEVRVQDDQHRVEVRKGAEDKRIYWQIDGTPPGLYVFTEAGIAPKPTTTGWGDNFKDDERSDDGRTFSWKNRNKADQAGKEYDYEVRVVNAAGVACKQDPVIKNQS